jgi:hypothetical protein
MRVALLAAAAALIAGVVVWSSLDSPRGARLREVERLAPAARAPACAPAAEETQAFAAALRADRPCEWLRPQPGAALQRFASAAGPEAAPFLEQVASRCATDEPTRAGCAALDALMLLARAQSGPAVTALQQKARATGQPVEAWFGAAMRLWAVRPPSAPELLALLDAVTDPRARAEVLARLRALRDPSTRGALQALYDRQAGPERAQVRAALLELEHPGRCVSEDDGQGSGKVCVYSCPGEAARRAVLRQSNVSCPLTFEP